MSCLAFLLKGFSLVFSRHCPGTPFIVSGG
jgi:hypothetical protein